MTQAVKEIQSDLRNRKHIILCIEDNRANRNALRKVYISRSIRSDMAAGDIIVFYRTASGGAAYYTSVEYLDSNVGRVIRKLRELRVEQGQETVEGCIVARVRRSREHDEVS